MGEWINNHNLPTTMRNKISEMDPVFSLRHPHRRRRTNEEDEGRTWKVEDSTFRITNCDTEGCERRANILFDRETGIPIEYTCEHVLLSRFNAGVPQDGTLFELDSTPMPTLSETQLVVDYEALMDRNADVSTNERLLQWRVLLSAVDSVDLDTCNFLKLKSFHTEGEPVLSSAATASNSGDPLQRTLQQARQAQADLPENVTLFAIQNDLEDSQSPEIPCSFLEQDDNDICMPVRTVLTLKYQGEDMDAPLIREFIKDNLEKRMQDRSNPMLVGDVTALYYVGTHDWTEVSDATGDGVNASSRSTGNDNVIRTGLLISAASALVLILFLLAIRRRSSRESEVESDSSAMVTHEILPDIPSADMEDNVEKAMFSPTEVLKRPSSKGLLSEDPSADVDTAAAATEQKSQTHDEVSTIAGLSQFTAEEMIFTDDHDDHDLLMDNDTESIFRSASGGSGDSQSSEANLLPPRPPPSRRETPVPLVAASLPGGSLLASQGQSQKKRRKKKKKKRPTLVRVNSREEVNTMAAIPESTEQDDGEEEYESGSEYYSSTDDEIGSNPSSSGYSTPNLSLSASRSDSPSTSSRKLAAAGVSVPPSSTSSAPHQPQPPTSSSTEQQATKIIDALNLHLEEEEELDNLAIGRSSSTGDDIFVGIPSTISEDPTLLASNVTRMEH